jgi:phosphoribosylformylglycinamidine synthase
MQKTNNPRVLIPSGYGLNCEEETAFGYKALGADVDIVHINDIVGNPEMIDDYHILALIGGFADGDHIASGKIHANRLRYLLGGQLHRFIDEGKLIIGVCNGFQSMVKAGLLPALDGNYDKETLTLTYNDSGRFEDRWIHLGANPKSKCVWTRGIDKLYLPIRHGEGKIRVANEDVLKGLEASNQIALFYINPETGKTASESEYPYNPNGSVHGIAGICDPTGRVFGMMPHWEAFMSPYNHPSWTRLKAEGALPAEGLGMQVARNGIRYVKENLLDKA